jgi:dihydrofolate synthase / folylpolyglutamate synthase
MFQTYEATLEFLYDNLPMFQRIGAPALKNDLANIVRLCEALQHPEKKFKSIHIAGTNGKGSTSHMLASVLQASGYKTGLYTSPHLKDFTERIRIDGKEISRSFIVDFVNRIRPVIEEIQPSFFEITVAMAFDYFASENIDVAVIEVGLGGRLDSTNVINPELCIITNIGWDHKDLLGDTLEKIAAEKAGIIKSRIPVVISERQNGIDRVFEQTADRLLAPVHFASDHFNATQYESHGHVLLNVYRSHSQVFKDLNLPLQGYYQRKNILGVLMSVDLLRGMEWKISGAALKKGLEMVVKQTGLKGRWQILGRNPLRVCDTGHNVDGIKEVVNQIMTQSFTKLHIVFGMVKDKDITDVLKLLPRDATYYFCQAKIPRALDAELLADQANKLELNGFIVPDVNEAIRQAEKNAGPDDMIFIGGSTFVVAEIENL